MPKRKPLNHDKVIEKYKSAPLSYLGRPSINYVAKHFKVSRAAIHYHLDLEGLRKVDKSEIPSKH